MLLSSFYTALLTVFRNALVTRHDAPNESFGVFAQRIANRLFVDASDVLAGNVIHVEPFQGAYVVSYDPDVYGDYRPTRIEWDGYIWSLSTELGLHGYDVSVVSTVYNPNFIETTFVCLEN